MIALDGRIILRHFLLELRAYSLSNAKKNGEGSTDIVIEYRRVICHRHGVVLGPFFLLQHLLADATIYDPIVHRSKPRGKNSTEEDMGKVKAFHETNVSHREIARRMGRSRGVFNTS